MPLPLGRQNRARTVSSGVTNPDSVEWWKFGQASRMRPRTVPNVRSGLWQGRLTVT